MNKDFNKFMDSLKIQDKPEDMPTFECLSFVEQVFPLIKEQKEKGIVSNITNYELAHWYLDGDDWEIKLHVYVIDYPEMLQVNGNSYGHFQIIDEDSVIMSEGTLEDTPLVEG
jgi:hypothetical protein